MARLQDFQTVTPTSSDKLLVVQSQGQGICTTDKIITDVTVSALDTTDKKVAGAINEVRESVVNITKSDTVTAGTDVTLYRHALRKVGTSKFFCAAFKITVAKASQSVIFTLPSGYSANSGCDMMVIGDDGKGYWFYVTGSDIKANKAMPVQDYFVNGFIP